MDELLEPLWPKDIDRPLDLDPSRFPHARDWPKAFDQSSFDPLRQSRIANVHTLDPDGLVAFFASMGWIGALPDEELRRVLGEIRSRLTDNEYRLPFETDVHWTRLSVGHR